MATTSKHFEGMAMRGKHVRPGRLAAWISAALLVVSCGGGGGESGTAPFQSDGAGAPAFGPGSGAPGFGGGSGGGTGSSGDGPLPTPDATVQVSTADVQGTVVNAQTGTPLGGSTGTLGSLVMTADSSGFFSTETYAATSRAVIRVAAAGYESLYRPIEILGDPPSSHLFKLVAQGTPSAVDATAGGSVVAAGSPGQVTFPASAVTDQSNAVLTTSFDARVTPISPGADPYLLSGDYAAGAGVPLESFGGANIIATQDIRIAVGSTVTARIPVSSRNGSPPASARMYRLDTSTGYWTDAGAATLSGDGTYYQGSIDAFGLWMVGAPLVSPVQVTGCVVDEAQNPAASTRVAIEGINYSGVNYATTDTNGRFVVSAKPGSTVIIQGQRGVFLSNAISTVVGTSNMTLPNCLSVPSGNGITMRLTWGPTPSDIDSHLRVPGGTHVYYGASGSLSAEPYASLDVDDTSGNGPEVTTIRRPKAGVYRFYLHNYSGTFTPGMTASPTRVELNYGGRTVVFTPPAGEGSSRYWHLFDLQIGSNCAMTLYRYNRWRIDQPADANQNGANGQACVPN